MATNVSTFSELKTAIEDTATTEILVTSNITFSGGAAVNLNKNNLVIDFNGFTVTDNNNSSFTDTIYIASTTKTISMTIKNAIWSGRNYYGVVGVYDGNTNVTINIENITYTGPQFIYNKYGTTNIINCNVTLDKNSSSTNPQEFCEANRLNISGNVTVLSNTTSNAVIWFTGTGAALTIAKDSIFNVTALSSYFLYTDVSPVMLFDENSSTTIKTKNGLFYSTGASSHIASSFTLNKNASFVASQTSSNSTPLFKCISNFTANENSIFRLFSEASGSAALMYFGQQANINFNSPKNVVLYNNSGNIFSFQTGSTASPNTMVINAEMLRLWDTAKSPISSAGNLSDNPTTEYYKNNYSSNLITTFKLTNSALISADNNLETGDTGYPLSTTIKLLTSKVISFGTIPLTINEVSDISKEISGTTEIDSNIETSFDSKTFTGTANEQGVYSLPIDTKITIGTEVKVSANNNFLTKTLSTTSVGSVSITSIEPLEFYTFTNQSNLETISRITSDWTIEITDTRTTGSNWYLYVYISKPLTSGDNTLDNGLVYVSENQTQIISETPTLIYTGTWNETQKVTKLTWDTDKGFLLKIDKDKTYVAGKYTTEIFGQITTEPLW